VFAVGHAGIIVRGTGDTWEVQEFPEIGDDIWGVQEFDDRVFVSTFSEVYEVAADRITVTSKAIDTEYACYSLAVSEGYLWSVGEKHVFRFDGTTWNSVL
jgi:hypothetical protein